ncbi:MAG TPA: proline dehydrogenase family protein [Thermoanaerobaculia bacterium]|nr:proline dehydrogenase family protein [Thermoanaerobaculia bacterium]
MSVLNRLLVTTLPLVPRFIVGRVASRYVAGETLEQALAVVRALNQQGAMATIDLLGEEVHERGKALAAVEEYLRVFAAIDSQGLDSNVSIKLTLLGLKIDQAFCRDNVERIAEVAEARRNFVRIDMEDSTCVDATLRIYRDLHERHGNLGVVLQAYMRRTLSDIAALPRGASSVRICKGIYVEPRRIAWKGHETVRANFVRALEKLIEQGIYPAIATHDEYLTAAATALIDRHRLAPHQYEFQMLLGVDQELREILIAGGHRLRVYVPYGADWYPYSIRRLRENPEVARHVLRALLAGRAGGTAPAAAPVARPAASPSSPAAPAAPATPIPSSER